MIEVHLFTRQLDFIEIYETEHVPAEADRITIGDAHYRVTTRTWEEPQSDEPSVQLRAKVIDDGD